MTGRLIKLESFKDVAELEVKLLLKERFEIRKQVDKELHNLTDVRKKMELTIDDFIRETNYLKLRQDSDFKELEKRIHMIKEPVENTL